MSGFKIENPWFRKKLGVLLFIHKGYYVDKVIHSPASSGSIADLIANHMVLIEYFNEDKSYPQAHRFS